jgi:hypothetical protein
MLHGNEVYEEQMLCVNYCFYQLNMLFSNDGLQDAIKAEEELECIAHVLIVAEIGVYQNK